MLITYFKDSRTLARYCSGLANLYLENFIVWLESQGYRRFTIRRHVREVAHFADWAEAEGLALRDLDRGALNRLCSQLAERNSLRYPCGKQRQICHSACLWIDFLEAVGAVETCPGDPLLCPAGSAFLTRCLRAPFHEETALLGVRKLPFLEVSPTGLLRRFLFYRDKVRRCREAGATS